MAWDIGGSHVGGNPVEIKHQLTIGKKNTLQPRERLSRYVLFHLISLNFCYTRSKVKLSLCLINLAQRHDDVCGSEGIAPPFFTSAIDGGEWPSFTLRPSYPGNRAPGTH
jgi:hypothetical protein